MDDPFNEERMLPLVRDGNWNLIRADIDPLRDVDHLLPGDELLVITDAYDGDPEPKWCDVLSIAPGTAAVYPIRVQVPERGQGQYALPEVLGWRRPVAGHQDLMYRRKQAGLPESEEEAINQITAL